MRFPTPRDPQAQSYLLTDPQCLQNVSSRPDCLPDTTIPLVWPFPMAALGPSSSTHPHLSLPFSSHSMLTALSSKAFGPKPASCLTSQFTRGPSSKDRKTEHIWPILRASLNAPRFQTHRPPPHPSNDYH